MKDEIIATRDASCAAFLSTCCLLLGLDTSKPPGGRQGKDAGMSEGSQQASE
jgi:hypothetical protein